MRCLAPYPRVQVRAKPGPKPQDVAEQGAVWPKLLNDKINKILPCGSASARRTAEIISLVMRPCSRSAHLPRQDLRGPSIDILFALERNLDAVPNCKRRVYRSGRRGSHGKRSGS